MKNKTIAPLIALLTLALTPGTFAQGTAFTYQGRLADTGSPADGFFDITFSIWDAVAGPAQLGDTLTNTAVEVTDGLFTVTLDFGSSVFTGPDRWLEIGVATNGGGAFTTLGPRTKIDAAPYASYSGTAATVPNNAIGSSQLDNNLDLGTSSIVGTLDVYRTIAGTPAISLDGGTSTISTYGSDGQEQSRLWGVTYGELRLNNGTAGNAVSAKLSANSSSGGSLGLYDSAGATRADLSGANTGGSLTLYNSQSKTGILLYGDSADAGYLAVYNTNGSAKVSLDGSDPSFGGRITVNAMDGSSTVQLLGESSGAGLINVNNNVSQTRVAIDGRGNSSGGQITLYAADGGSGVNLYGDSGGGGLQYLYAADGSISVAVDGDSAGAGYMSVRDSGGSTRVALDGESAGTGGRVSVYDDTGTETIQILGAEDAATGGQILMRNASGTRTIQLDSDASGVACGYIRLYKSDGSVGVTIEGDNGGDGRITTQELSITGGSDLSEQFDIESAGDAVKPGAVVCIDPLKPGKLVLSSQAYDRTVAGVVSGAGGVKPGMLMGQAGTVADGEYPVALTGRVYCMVDASQDPIQPGDLITTSKVPGHGMKVTDHSNAQGAIIGKAMTALQDGQGLVLVLVSLQ